MFDFVKNATVDSLETVPEQFRGLYVEKDGKFSISDAAKPLVEAYVGQTTALNKTRNDLRSANDEAASRRVTKQAVLDFAKAQGIENVDENNPLESITAFVTDLVTKGKGGADVKVNLDKIKAEAERRISEVTSAKDGEIAKMKGSLEKYLVSQAATAALAKHGGNIDLLLDRVRGAVKVVPEGDEYVVRVVDASGDARSNGAGGYLDVDGFVAELKTQPSFAVAFKSEANGGTGHKPNTQTQKFTPKANGEKSSVDKIASGLAKNLNESGRSAAQA